MRSSHSLDRLDVAFDDDRLVADAGLLLPATLAAHLGLKDLVDEHLDLGDRPGRANAGDKLLTTRRGASRSRAQQSRVQRLVTIHHTAHIEALERRRLDCRPIQPIQSLIEEGELLCVVADESVDPVAQDLGDRTGAAGEDRRAAG